MAICVHHRLSHCRSLLLAVSKGDILMWLTEKYINFHHWHKQTVAVQVHCTRAVKSALAQWAVVQAGRCLGSYWGGSCLWYAKLWHVDCRYWRICAQLQGHRQLKLTKMHYTASPAATFTASMNVFSSGSSAPGYQNTRFDGTLFLCM